MQEWLASLGAVLVPWYGLWVGISNLGIQGASDGKGSPVEDVRIDHGGGDVPMAEELLDGSDIVSALEEVRREGVAQSPGRAANSLIPL